ncbi:MAG: metallophosphoesterase [Bryobacteraceae bacterium]|jgi:Calcineurin-like phosphoesterase
MLRRFLRSVSIVLLPCCPILAAAVDSNSRDFKKYPPVIERPLPATLYAIGDIHGDYQRLVRLLIAAQIVPAAPATPSDVKWRAGAATLVVTGDMIDKGPRAVDVLRLLIALCAAARQSRGEVILLAGNHEAEFLAAPDARKAADFIADLNKSGYSPPQVAACQNDLGAFLCTLPFAARVGDWFFSHAGNTDGRTVGQIAADIRSGVGRDGFATKQLTGPNSLLEARLGEGNTWFAAPKGGEKQLLASFAEALDAKHIVQGHQHNDVKFADGVERHTGEMFQRWGLLFLIDVGMSEGVGDSRGAALRIANGKAAAICADGAETLLWDAATNTDTGRAAPCTR